jgi:general secretion pathway protein A
MYNEFFGFAESPFNTTPNSRFYYRTSSCEDVLRVVRHGIEARKGVIVVTGEPGTGKTLFLKSLARDISAQVQTVVLFNPHTDLNGLLKLLLNELGLAAVDDNTTVMFDRLAEFLIEERRNQRTICLLIDEAQDLDEKTLDELRLLANLDFADEPLLPIVLSGQPELHAKLDHSAAKRIKQRIALACQTYPLVRMEVAPYVAHRLQLVDYSGPDLFEPKALERIATYSGGIPRMINSICDNCLLRAFAANRKVISWEIVDRVAREMHLTGPSKLLPQRAAHKEQNRDPAVSGAVHDLTASDAAAVEAKDDATGSQTLRVSAHSKNASNLEHTTAGLLDRPTETGGREVSQDQWISGSERRGKSSELQSQSQQSSNGETQPFPSGSATVQARNARRMVGGPRLYWYSLAAALVLLLLVIGFTAGFPRLADIYPELNLLRSVFLIQEQQREADNRNAVPEPEYSPTVPDALSNEQTLTHSRLNLATLHLDAGIHTDSGNTHDINGTTTTVSNGHSPVVEHGTKSPDPDQPETSTKTNGSKNNDRRNTVTVLSASLVRSKPADKAEIISTLEPGSRVTVLARSRDYYLVRSTDPPIRGYVHREDAFFDRKN